MTISFVSLGLGMSAVFLPLFRGTKYIIILFEPVSLGGHHEAPALPLSMDSTLLWLVSDTASRANHAYTLVKGTDHLNAHWPRQW